MGTSRNVVCTILHDDHALIPAALTAQEAVGSLYCFVRRVPWHGRSGDWERAAESARDAGAEVILGDWTFELDQRNAAQAWLLEHDFTHTLILDGDEVIEPELLRALQNVAESELADRVYVEWDTYWKSPEYVIRPREQFTPWVLIDLRKVTPIGGRNFEGGRELFLPASHGIIHHLSYVGTNHRIQRKIETWGHAKEVVPGWWENVWLKWDSDTTLRNLHPMHPPARGFAERIHVPEMRRSPAH